MDFVDAIRICFRKYAIFTGRAARPEYWWFELFVVVVQAVCDVLYRPLGIAFSLAVLLPSLAVSVRRLHDTDRSAWWLLLCFVPLIGWIVLIVFYCQRGTDGPNRFGDAPFISVKELPAGT